jgi:hypothetical protein
MMTNRQAILALCGGFVGILGWIARAALGFRYALNFGDSDQAFAVFCLVGDTLSWLAAKVLHVE